MRVRDTVSSGDIDSSEVMDLKRYATALGWALGMLVLILDGRTAMAGATQGLQLCMTTLIPSLFPFFVLSAMLTSRLADGGLLLAGVLGGYPLGAGNAARAFRSGYLGKAEAERLAVLSNCAGPSFLFGVLGPVLGGPGRALALWGVYLLSIPVLGMVLPRGGGCRGKSRPLTVQQALTASIRAMAGVCGWVILFRVMLAILDRWVLWLLPDWGRTAVYGLLELSNGCIALDGMAPGPAFVLAAGFLAFGGVCVFLQTASVAPCLSLKLYFPGKCFQAAVSMLLASLVMPGTVGTEAQAAMAGAAALFGFLLRKSEKRYGNCPPVIV